MILHHASNPSRIHKVVLLINFGSPSALSREAIKAFLLELFQDQEFHLPPLIQQLLVRSWIIPRHIDKSMARYRSIWTKEGSPLLVQSEKFAKKLSSLLPDDTAVAVAMQYGQPSIKHTISELRNRNIEELVIIPLFPQEVPFLSYSILSSVFHVLSQWRSFPRTTFIPSFYKDRWYIENEARRLQQARPEDYDHVILSFHAIPHDRLGRSTIYQHQCFVSAQMIMEEAALPASSFSISFQSKAGIGRWTTPSTQTLLDSLLKEGKKRILVMCPSFIVDCVETLGEIAVEYRTDFLRKGGEALGLVESLNDFQPFVEGIAAFLIAQKKHLNSPVNGKINVCKQ